MGWLVLLIFLGLYGLPAFIAGRRNHPDKNSIALWSLLLGWTVLVWMACLVWACNSRAKLKAP